MKILFIDDEETILEILSEMITDELGAEVISFLDTAPAFEYFEKNQDISLIISDYKLPTETGIEFYAKVQARGLPFLLMTGMNFSSDNEAINSFLSMPKNKIVNKPIDTDDLMLIVKEYL